MKLLATLFAGWLLLTGASPAPAQDAPKSEIEFVRKMRAQGYADLSLEYLDKLRKQYKSDKNLELEIINSQLAMAEQAPEAAKRVALLDEARVALQTFVKNNPKHPEVTNAKFQIIQVSAKQGRAQLRYANSLSPDDIERGQAYTDARRLINDASAELKKQLGTFKDVQAEQAKLEIAILALDEIDTLVTKSLSFRRGPKLNAACGALDDLVAALPQESPRRYLALAYAGRAYSLNANKDEAEKRFDQVINVPISKLPARSEAKRMALYFLVLHETKLLLDGSDAKNQSKINTVLAKSGNWLTYFGTVASPELFGIRFVNGQLLFNRGLAAKRPADLTLAKQNLSQVEAFENDFTGRAVKLKLEIMALEGAFNKEIKDLIVFEDLYYRSVYEHQELNKLTAQDEQMDMLKADDPKKIEHDKKKNEKRDAIVTLLARAVERAKGKRVIERNLNNARFMLTGYHLTLGIKDLQKAGELNDKGDAKQALASVVEAEAHLKSAAEAGERMMDQAPRASRTPLAALYAAQATDTLITRTQPLHNSLLDKVGDPQAIEKQKALIEATKSFKDNRIKLSEKILKSFPGSDAAKYSEYFWVLHLIESDKTEEALKYPGDLTFYLLGRKKLDKEDLPLGVKFLRKVTPKYQDYCNAQYLIAMACMQLHANMRKLEGGGDPRATALEVLEKYPLPPKDAEEISNVYYALGKRTLVGMLYEDKKYDNLTTEANKFLTELKTLAMEEDRRDQYRTDVAQYLVYVPYAQVQPLYNAAKYQEVTKLLDPTIKKLEDKNSVENAYVTKKNWQMITALMQPAFLAYLQSGNLDEAENVRKTWKSLIDQAKAHAVWMTEQNARGSGATEAQVKEAKEGTLREWAERDLDMATLLKKIVGIMVKQMDLLKKQGDQKKLQTTVENFTNYLNKFKNDVSKDLHLARYLALSFESIKKYQNAIDLLEDVFKQGKKPEKKTDPNYATWNNLELVLVREYRLYAEADPSKYAEMSEKAFQKISSIRKERDKDLLAIKEELEVLICKKLYASAANRAYALVKQLRPFLLNKPGVKPHYFDAYFALIRAYYGYAKSVDNAAEAQKALISTAKQQIKLEELLEDVIANDKERKLYRERFDKFMDEHRDLKEAVEKQRGGN